MKFFILLLFLFKSSIFYSQNQNYTSKIPLNLLENANAVVRLDDQNIEIVSRKSMVITTKRVVTILNEKGLRHLNAGEYFSTSRKIKSIEATVLDKDGLEIKKIKRRDFKEYAVSDGSVITDNKLLSIDYIPIVYPFTLIFDSTVETSNTAFIPSWYPVPSYYVGVESSSRTISCPPELGLKYKEFNFGSESNITKEERLNLVAYSAKNIAPYKYEDFSPDYQNYFPHVLFGLNLFNLEGVEGVASDWKTFGSWIYDSLLANTTEIPLETQDKIKNLVGDEKDPLRISKIIYQYVQDKTRYISIQLGIGGWKPMLAKDVDRLGYGDCKALTNYTRALLEIVGVPSYYTIVYGDSAVRNLQSDFVSMQGNHVILAVPIEGKIHWLECTSQVNPFGFQGDFTDNRLALVIKPDGGEIMRTHEFKTEQNSQISSGAFTVDEMGMISGSVTIKSKGTQYDNKFANGTMSIAEQKDFYKDYFSHVNNISLQKINLSNNEENVEFQEEISFQAASYGSINSNRMMFAVNACNPARTVPQRYRTRNNPFEISRGFFDYDEITITIPSGYAIEAKPDNYELEDKFGSYKVEYILTSENTLQYKRSYQMNSGSHEKTEYEDFRKFRETIARMDNAKIVLIKKH